MSPIEFINSPMYKEKLKKVEIKVDFGFVSDKKLEKISARKRDALISKCNKENIESGILDIENDENSFLRTNDSCV